MNIHLPAILMFTRATRFWHTAISLKTQIHFECQRKSEKQPSSGETLASLEFHGRGEATSGGDEELEAAVAFDWFDFTDFTWAHFTGCWFRRFLEFPSLPFGHFAKLWHDEEWPIWSHLIPFVDALPIKIVIFIDFPQQTVKLPGRSGMTLASGPRWWCFGGRGRGQRLLGWTRWIR